MFNSSSSKVIAILTIALAVVTCGYFFKVVENQDLHNRVREVTSAPSATLDDARLQEYRDFVVALIDRQTSIINNRVAALKNTNPSESQTAYLRTIESASENLSEKVRLTIQTNTRPTDGHPLD